MKPFDLKKYISEAAGGFATPKQIEKLNKALSLSDKAFKEIDNCVDTLDDMLAELDLAVTASNRIDINGPSSKDWKAFVSAAKTLQDKLSSLDEKLRAALKS